MLISTVAWSYILDHLEYALRLANGRGSYEGRVEVYYKGEWGSVCDDEFGDQEAEVVCKYLGFLGAEEVFPRAGQFGEGAGSIWLDDLDCDGTEYSPFHCRHKGFGCHDCQHVEDVGVRCTSKLTYVR